MPAAVEPLPPSRPKRQLVIKDKHGNVVDMNALKAKVETTKVLPSEPVKEGGGDDAGGSGGVVAGDGADGAKIDATEATSVAVSAQTPLVGEKDAVKSKNMNEDETAEKGSVSGTSADHAASATTASSSSSSSSSSTAAIETVQAKAEAAGEVKVMTTAEPNPTKESVSALASAPEVHGDVLTTSTTTTISANETAVTAAVAAMTVEEPTVAATSPVQSLPPTAAPTPVVPVIEAITPVAIVDAPIAPVVETSAAVIAVASVATVSVPVTPVSQQRQPSPTEILSSSSSSTSATTTTTLEQVNVTNASVATTTTTTSASIATISAAATSSVSVSPTPPPSRPEVHQTPTGPEPDDDDWEGAAEKITSSDALAQTANPTPAAAVSMPRSLRPGGSTAGSTVRLNAGHSFLQSFINKNNTFRTQPCLT